MFAASLLSRSAVVALAMAVLGAAVYSGVQFGVDRAVAVDAENKARGWAAYLIDTLPRLGSLISEGRPDAAQLGVIATAEKAGDVFRFKLFDRWGYVTLVSDEAAYASERPAEREHSARAAAVLASGVADVSLNDGTGSAHRPPLYVEAYVPVADAAGEVLGVVEVYIDQTKTASLFRTSFATLAIGLSALVALVFGLPAVAFLWRSRQARLARRQVEYLARYDPLTGLFNRASFTERLGAALARRPAGEAMALVFIDVDDFKGLNDVHGHAAGDEFLKHVARCIARACGENAVAARLGGDEFTIALPGRDVVGASKLVGEMMSAATQPIVVRGCTVTGSVSCGIHAVEDGATEIADAMYKADVALYQAKLDGPFTSRVFTDDMEAEMRERRHLELLIRSAVESESFELHYQPLLAVDSGDCAGFEALLRLRDFEGAFVPASRFIPALEKTGLIACVGKWAIGEAARTAATWPPHLFVAVNLSVKQFEDGELIGHVREALSASGLEPGRLELEVTESLLMENSASIGPQLEELRSLGVTIAMDDFGTGYSSLGCLWRFGFDKLKIDRAFVSALDHDSQAREVLDTIIMLGHKLNMRVTVEGIETAQQAEILSGLACDQFQGYLYGKPGPAAEIAPFIARRLRDKLAPRRYTPRETVEEAVA